MLFTVVENMYDWETARIVVHRFGSQDWRLVLSGAADARYVPTGHLVYFRRGRLMAVPFDLSGLKTKGSEVGLVSNVMQATNGATSGTDSGAAQMAVSATTGTLAYLAGGEVPDWNKRLVWVDRRGQVEPLDVEPRPYYVPRISPDGKLIAVMTLQSQRRVWVHDLRVPGSLFPVSRPEFGAGHPVWTRNGERVAFSGCLNGRPGLFWARLDGTPEEQLRPLGVRNYPAS